MPDVPQANLASAYNERVPTLEAVCAEVEVLLRSILNQTPRIDKIAARTKNTERFVEKAARRDQTTGELKYPQPLEEIQDQIALRVVVYFNSDVPPVREKVLQEFREIEDVRKEEPDPGKFGYEAHHFVCVIPPDIIARHHSPVEFFELQVSTLFQHAWAEANHDLGYKETTPLTYDQRKQIAWAAAQAWGADEIFQSLWNTVRAQST